MNVNIINKYLPLTAYHTTVFTPGTHLTRFFTLRAEKVREKCLFPGKKPRHERCNLPELIKKSEEDYVDFQEAGLWGCWLGHCYSSVPD